MHNELCKKITTNKNFELGITGAILNNYQIVMEHSNEEKKEYT